MHQGGRGAGVQRGGKIRAVPAEGEAVGTEAARARAFRTSFKQLQTHLRSYLHPIQNIGSSGDRKVLEQ